MIAVVSLAFALNGTYATVAIPFLISGVSGGLLSLFFGRVSGVLNGTQPPLPLPPKAN